MTNHQEPLPPNEPSVWDYFVSKIQFWNREKLGQEEQKTEQQATKQIYFPWLSVLSLVFALIAQLSLEPSVGRTPIPGILLYTVALGCLIGAVMRQEWQLIHLKPDADEPLGMSFRVEFLLTGLVLAILSFLLFGNGKFGLLNTSLWLLGLTFVLFAFWQPKEKRFSKISSFLEQLRKDEFKVRLTRWGIILMAALAIVLFFNFHRLEAVPPEMVSDQAEKLLDINDILRGYTPVYFPRNTGREVLHFYLTAAYMKVFNLDVSFLNLKVVAVFANLVTVLFIYLLGKEMGNKWVGLAAALFAGIAYWPLIFTRVALRIPYYPLFVAPVMYFMVRGLRRQNTNDILLTGLFLGLGLHGYTPFRIVPIFVVLGILIYIFHRPGKDRKLRSVFALSLITLVSLIVFIPLLRYWLANPEMFSYRAFSRLTQMEAGFQNHPIMIFLSNFWKASIMFFWDNGSIWVHSIPGRPALDVVSGALYFLGIVSLIIRYIRKRQWNDLYLLVSIPMLMMPSILSLAFPAENPSLNRTAGATVPVFIVIGLTFESVIRTFYQRISGRIGRIVSLAVALLLVIWSGVNNYDLVFNQYYAIYRTSSWNTSEIGKVAAFFIESMGTPETTYAVGFPHWADSRLIAINAGYTGMDFAIFPDQIPTTAQDPRSKVFFLNINDSEGMQVLRETFPDSVAWRYDSAIENKDFMIFFVPPFQGVTP